MEIKLTQNHLQGIIGGLGAALATAGLTLLVVLATRNAPPPPPPEAPPLAAAPTRKIAPLVPVVPPPVAPMPKRFNVSCPYCGRIFFVLPTSTGLLHGEDHPTESMIPGKGTGK